MWTIILCAAIPFVIVFYTAAVLDGEGFAVGLVAGLSFAFVGAVVGWFAALIIGACFYDTPTQTVQTKTPLLNLADNSETRGHLVLGTGTIEGVPVYAWYESNGTNSFVQKRADADASEIHYIEDGRPYYTVTLEQPDAPFFSTWGIYSASSDSTPEYDFYVPKGSIKPNYVLDAKD